MKRQQLEWAIPPRAIAFALVGGAACWALLFGLFLLVKDLLA